MLGTSKLKKSLDIVKLKTHVKFMLIGFSETKRRLNTAVNEFIEHLCRFVNMFVILMFPI